MYKYADFIGVEVGEFFPQTLLTDRSEHENDTVLRVVVLGEISLETVTESVQTVDPKNIIRPFIVWSTKTNGDIRTWFIPTRREARELVKKYKSENASAILRDIRKEI